MGVHPFIRPVHLPGGFVAEVCQEPNDGLSVIIWRDENRGDGIIYACADVRDVQRHIRIICKACEQRA